jgi:hypothetical protein
MVARWLVGAAIPIACIGRKKSGDKKITHTTYSRYV